MPRPLYSHGRSPLYPLDRRLGGPQSRSGNGGEKNSHHRPCRKLRPGRPSRSLVPTRTSLFPKLLLNGNWPKGLIRERYNNYSLMSMQGMDNCLPQRPDGAISKWLRDDGEPHEKNLHTSKWSNLYNYSHRVSILWRHNHSIIKSGMIL
jgi:hypothetical protein